MSRFLLTQDSRHLPPWLIFDVGQKIPAPVTNPSIEKEVISFLAARTRYAAAKITPTTTLFGDIGIDGDEGDDFLTAFMERFQVDMSACRRVHFGGEGFVPWAPLLWIRQAWIAYAKRNSTPESRSGMVPITVQDLIESARARQWVLKYEEEEANQAVQRTSATPPSLT